MEDLRVNVRRTSFDGSSGLENNVLDALKRVDIKVVDHVVGKVSARILLLEGGDDSQDFDDVCSGTDNVVTIAVVATGKRISKSGISALFQSGVSDLLIWDELSDPSGSLRAKIERRTELERIISLPVVRKNLIGESPVWRNILLQVAEVARFTDCGVLLVGETGTGKELLARLVHTLDSNRNQAQLITLDCTTVVPELAGSEFFGHERGAFTHAVSRREGAFSMADKGTLFLDEVGELPEPLQADLLRVVQEGKYKPVGGDTYKDTDFRLVCATHRDVAARAGTGEFRADFYHRIAGWPIQIPPLRERRADILPLARHFAIDVLDLEDGTDPVFDSAVEDYLVARDYPGNVRELRQLVKRLAMRHAGPPPITLGDMPDRDRMEAFGGAHGDWTVGEFENAMRRAVAMGADFKEIKTKTSEVVIEVAIEHAGGVQPAAIRLGVSGRTIQNGRARSDHGRPRPRG